MPVVRKKYSYRKIKEIIKEHFRKQADVKISDCFGNVLFICAAGWRTHGLAGLLHEELTEKSQFYSMSFKVLLKLGVYTVGKSN